MIRIFTWYLCFLGNIACAILQEAVEMTTTAELLYSEPVNTDQPGTVEKLTQNVSEAEAEPEVEDNQKEENNMKEKDDEEKKDERPQEESLKLTSWVEVENDGESPEVEIEPQVTEVSEDVEAQMLLEMEGRTTVEAEEEEQTRSVEEELAMMEEKWKEQCAINETLKQRLANEEERFRVRELIDCLKAQSSGVCV